MENVRIKSAGVKQLIVIAVLLTGLVAYRTLESPAELRNHFLTLLVSWNLASLMVLTWSVRFIERRQFCNWFRCSFSKIGISRIAVYLSFSALLAFLEILIYRSIRPGLSIAAIFWSSFLFYSFVYFISTVIIEVSKLVGKGFTEKIILGKYHVSRQEKRIFLFIDLRESTKLSKELSLEKYSLLIKEFFRDIDMAMEKYDGEIYQYAGDEVIVTWPALSSNYDNAVQAFSEFYEQMKAKRTDYILHYGVAPRFKAAIHSGKVIGTWVGRMKRELVFQGDVLNITARLTTLAKNLSYPILMTKQVSDKLGEATRRRVLPAGNYSLKGIESPFTIYFLRPLPSFNFQQEISPLVNSISENDVEMFQQN